VPSGSIDKPVHDHPPADITRLSLTWIDCTADVHALSAEWTELAESGGSPFLTREWLQAWWRAFGKGEPKCPIVWGGDGRLLAAAFLGMSGHRVSAAANVHSGEWHILGASEAARRSVVEALVETDASRLTLGPMRRGAGSDLVVDALRAARYLVHCEFRLSPYMALPDRPEDVLSSASKTLRAQVRRRRRALEREGELTLRTVSQRPELEAALDAVFAVEGSGWKARSKTAITSDARTELLYRGFAHRATARGWLRLHLLELDGEPIAVEYGCAFARTAFLLKTGFRESWGCFSPGLVLRAAVLEQAVSEDLREYDFLGGPDAYKLRWTDDIRSRVTIRAYRPARGLPAYAYRSMMRPRLQALRDAAREKVTRRAT